MAVDADEFAASYWARRPLLSTAGQLGGTFTDLLTLDDVDELVSRRGLRTPFLRIAKDGEVVPASRFTGSGGAGATITDQVRDEKVLELFAAGSTLVLQGLHRLWPPLVAFAGQLRTDLGHPVQVNAYVTPPSSQGFSAHYDVHDVFVLQVAGEKHWTIHAPVLADPLPGQPWTDRREEVAAAAQGEPLVDAVLRPGDALYLPRGHLHSAVALGEVSAHLTVGVPATTRRDLVEALLALVDDTPALRASLPLGVDVTDPDDLAGPLQDTVAALVERLRDVDPVAVADRMARRSLQAGRPAPLSPVAHAAALAAVDAGSLVRLRPHLPLAERPGPDEGLVLVLADRRIALPGRVRDAVAALRTGAPWRVGDLPGLDAQEQVELARRLLREAVLVPAGPPGAGAAPA
ncbi:cupin domain-containing protein [Vallicoccus soli]|uniref:cupin domain-containing protein n=1 Tax=Vallicoccus soli TaxID=2339232 RepID=UPI001C499E6B|nr:cupin domain-containing protein [Vallicoccus soli]